MKILMINGTMRKSSTYNIGKMLIERIKQPEDTLNELFLPKDMPEFCRGCGVCIMQGERKCPDYLIYMKRITALIDGADLLVFTTPVFVYHATGQMKTLLDHYGYRWMVHRPEASMFRKQAVCITTAAGGGMKKAAKDITDSLRFWGVGRIYTYGKAVRAVSWDGVSEELKTGIQNDIQQLAQKITRDSSQVTPRISTKLMFYIMRIVQKKGGVNPADLAYWKEKGWTERKRPWK